MQCFSCKKFIKRGHGTQIWYHPNPNDILRVGVRGENQYYCLLCLKIKDYRERMNREKYKYLIKDSAWISLSFITIIILVLLYYNMKEYRQLILISSLLTLPLLILIDYLL